MRKIWKLVLVGGLVLILGGGVLTWSLLRKREFYLPVGNYEKTVFDEGQMCLEVKSGEVVYPVFEGRVEIGSSVGLKGKYNWLRLENDKGLECEYQVASLPEYVNFEEVERETVLTRLDGKKVAGCGGEVDLVLTCYKDGKQVRLSRWMFFGERE